ncbi:MAG TPA: LemA family protein [Candidatus Thermoplasmatota archaeon]|nr:LemA family protein [Candidatus Thermoplasmatota archaeon]
MSILAWVLLALAAVLAVYIVVLINRFVRYENAIANAWAQIDVQLQRRGELIPNLVETVKGYAKHEKATIQAVSDARARMVGAQDPEAKMEANDLLGAALGRLFAVSEAYPDLKANTNFLQLQDELSHTENKVAFARQHYNDAVLRFNNAIQTYPAKVFAGSRTAKPMLSVPEASKAVPVVKF